MTTPGQNRRRPPYPPCSLVPCYLVRPPVPVPVFRVLFYLQSTESQTGDRHHSGALSRGFNNENFLSGLRSRGDGGRGGPLNFGLRSGGDGGRGGPLNFGDSDDRNNRRGLGGSGVGEDSGRRFGTSGGGGSHVFGRREPTMTYEPPPPPDSEEEIFKPCQTGINFDQFRGILVQKSGVRVPQPISSFEEADLTETLINNVYKAGYVKLTPIQEHSIPIVMAGRDLIACARTGTGKTAAFLLPIVADLVKNGITANPLKDLQEPEAIIVAPSRELIHQIYLEARKFAYGTTIRAVAIYGGTSLFHTLREIFQGCNILCATPGRLLDVINRAKIGLSKVKYFVLDEADCLLSMKHVKKLLSREIMPGELVRTLLFSSTFPWHIKRLAREVLKPDCLSVVIEQACGACSNVEQEILDIGSHEKMDKLLEIVQCIGRDHTIVFVKTKKMADIIAAVLRDLRIPSTSLHGDRGQRDREEALRDFRSGECPVLVATSVIARGLAVGNVHLVINFDMPSNICDYINRIGRISQCGNSGRAISFFIRNGEDELRIVCSLVRVLTKGGDLQEDDSSSSPGR